MIHREAEHLASFCASRGWLDTEYFEWCIYAIEKRLCILLFSIIVVIWSLLSRLYLETAILSMALYILRSRFGGWHAKSIFSCLMISTGLVAGSSLLSFVISKYVSREYLLIASTVITWVGLNLDPVYPEQTHITHEEVKINKKKKNKLLILFYFVQLFFSLLYLQQILAPIFISITISVFSVVIEKTIQRRKRNENEP